MPVIAPAWRAPGSWPSRRRRLGRIDNMLIVLRGLPGTGNTTLAKTLAAHLECTYLCIDSIEQALRNSGALRQDIGTGGYQVANIIALDNLKAGLKVVADCVKPVTESRQAWADAAAQARCPLLNVQIICSDLDQHRQRRTTAGGARLAVGHGPRVRALAAEATDRRYRAAVDARSTGTAHRAANRLSASPRLKTPGIAHKKTDPLGIGLLACSDALAVWPAPVAGVGERIPDRLRPPAGAAQKSRLSPSNAATR